MSDTTTQAPEAGETTAPINIPSSGGLAGDEQGFIDWDTLEPDQPSPGDEELRNEDHEFLKEEPEPAPPVEEEKKRPSGAQRAKVQRDSLLSQIAERDRKIAELMESRTKEGVTPPPEPNFDGDLYGFEQNVSAETRQKEAREVLEALLKERDQVATRERELKDAHDAMEAHLERVESARKSIADYDKALESMKNVEVRNELIQEITRSDQSGLIAYHLAKHPDELAALDDMTPQEMAKTIGRLEARLEKALSGKKATTAPPPLSQPKGGVSPKDQTAEVNAWLDRTYGSNRRR